MGQVEYDANLYNVVSEARMGIGQELLNEAMQYVNYSNTDYYNDEDTGDFLDVDSNFNNLVQTNVVEGNVVVNQQTSPYMEQDTYEAPVVNNQPVEQDPYTERMNRAKQDFDRRMQDKQQNLGR